VKLWFGLPRTAGASLFKTGISARTLFSYFKTKEELLQYWSDSNFHDELRPTREAETNGKAPLLATRDSILKLCSLYEADHSVLVDRLYRCFAPWRCSRSVRCALPSKSGVMTPQHISS
jgi:AcrR family transcriptional regulator